MWAVIAAIRHWRAELQPVEFTVYTDHKNLEYFRKKQRLNERQLRWAVELNEYHCSLVHRPGEKQVLSDALSRRDQDVPKDWNDDCLKAREKVLLLGEGELSVNVDAEWIARTDWDNDGKTPDDTPTLGNISVVVTPFSDSRLTEL